MTDACEELTNFVEPGMRHRAPFERLDVHGIVVEQRDQVVEPMWPGLHRRHVCFDDRAILL